MRILMVHNDYARPSGEEHAVDMLSELLADKGHEVLQLRKSSAGLSDSPFAQAKAFFSGIHSPAAVRQVNEFLDREPVNVVQLQNLFPLWSPSILKAIRRRGLPVVMRCPNYRIFCPNGRCWSKGELCERCVTGGTRWCAIRNCEGSLPKSIGYALRSARARPQILEHVNMFLVLSEFQRRKFEQAGVAADRLTVLANAAEEQDLQEPETHHLGQRISFVGRPTVEKGIQLFVELARRLPDLPFAIAGGTAADCECSQPLPANVKCEGFLRGQRLVEFYQQSRLLVFPCQWYEGFPNTLLKAMALGKPVVASRIGVLPEIVNEEETGLLHEPTSVSDLSDKVLQLFHSPDLCREYGSRGRLRAAERFNRENCYQELISAYRQAGACVETAVEPVSRLVAHDSSDLMRCS